MGDSALQLAGIRPGRYGIWTFDFDELPLSAVRESVAELEELGYPTVWVPELRGREAFTQAAVLLAATGRMVIANGIARILYRTPRTTAAAQQTLADAYPGRYVLGLGLGGPPPGDGSPLAAMRAYLGEMDAAPTVAPESETVRVLAAYGPEMLRLAAESGAGAHTFLVPVEHTAVARGVLGPGPFLAPEQAVVIERDPEKAREVARRYLAPYLKSRFNLAKFRRLGYDESDFAGGGSDSLVDALVAWGTVEDVLARVSAHLEAGADHVCIQVLGRDAGEPAKVRWRILAEALFG